MSKPGDETRQHIINCVDDLVADLMYYDRKECEDLPRGAIEQAVQMGAISVDEMCERFCEQLRKCF